jgi:16S rRNA (cytosine967-C5)-methyltransferase
VPRAPACFQSLALAIACDVIRRSDRDHAADGVLRLELRKRADLSPATRREISEAFFGYYRWRGWLDRKKPLESRVAHALELAGRFRRNPFTLPEATLRAKAVPEWTADEMDCPLEWLRSLQREPHVWLRARRGQGRALAKKLRAARTVALPDAVLYEGRQDLFRTAEFQAGEFELQDINSQVVGALCDPKPGETWWDACAGEGGKTLHLADLMQNKGSLLATDRAEWRLDKLRQRAARAGVFNYRAAPWDGGENLPANVPFDGILVDAPCSGVGTWQRNPHARWTTRRADVKELGGIQTELLAHAAPAVKPGGKLVYAVCTMTRAETVEVVAAFERRYPEFEPLLLANPFPPNQTAAQLWFWPQHTRGNGMFVAAWRNSSASFAGSRVCP